MIIMDTWWKEMFSGALSIGLDEQKLKMLADEAFLYLCEDQPIYLKKAGVEEDIVGPTA